jgi:tripartite-type tricarboxylate transporter receptor subunit TctC
MWPDLPTVAESGYPAYQSTLWYALRAPDVKEQLRIQGAEAIGNTPAELEAFLREEVSRWGNVISTAHITSTE